MTPPKIKPSPIPPASGDLAPSKAGYKAVRFNATKHGILSRYTVLSHENQGDYQSLVTALMDDHKPVGLTEQHLVEELASVIWRKRRVLQAEGAIINQGLRSLSLSAKTVIPAAAPFEHGLSGEEADICDLMALNPQDVAELQRYAKLDLQATLKAATILLEGGANIYDKALQTLLPDSRNCWEDHLEEGDYPADAQGLAAYIRENLEPV